MKETPVVVETTYHANIESVWQAITVKEQMTQWFFDTIETFDPVPGFETEFNVKNGEINYLHLFRVEEVVPMRKLSIELKFGGIPGQALVTFSLSPSGNQTKLTLTHEGLETFPHDNPDFSRESCSGGWVYFLEESLAEFLRRA